MAYYMFTLRERLVMAYYMFTLRERLAMAYYMFTVREAGDGLLHDHSERGWRWLTTWSQ